MIVGSAYRVTSEDEGIRLLEMIVCSLCFMTAKRLRLHAEEINVRSKTPSARSTSRAILLALLVLAALTWSQSDFSGREIPDWKPILAVADAAREKGDLYYAKSLYLQGGRLAVWLDDWAGLLTAACGIKKLERERGPYSSTNALLLRAMVAAQKRQSRSGLVAVAKAFAALGDDKVASMVLSRIGKNWVEETYDSADIASPGCWDK